MCTLALYFRVFEEYPLLVAANRDEHYDRPAAAPQVLDTKPKIFAGKDLRAGGTWLGMNECGLIVGILNRQVSSDQSPARDCRSRGLLCLDLLKCRSLRKACALVASQEKVTYRPFTLVVSDKNESWVASNRASEIHTERLNPGLHVFSNTAEFDARSEKVNRAYHLFATLIDKSPSISEAPNSWVTQLAQILADHNSENHTPNPKGAICVHGEISGTVSSSIICYSRSEHEFQNFYSAGAPCRNPFLPQPNLAIR